MTGGGRGRRLGLPVLLVVFLVVASLTQPRFGSVQVLSAIAAESAIVAVAAIGATFVIAGGGIDLSVAGVAALAAVVSLRALAAGGLAAGLLAPLAVGVACGLVNGVLVGVLRIPAFVATLGSLLVFRGLALLVTGGPTLSVPQDQFDGAYTSFGTGSLGPLPYPFLVALVAYAAGGVLLWRTPFGRRVRAVGASPAAAAYAGIRVRRVRLQVLVVAGLFAGLAAVLFATQTWSADSASLEGYELVVIAAVVLGGTSLSGGRANLTGALAAAVLFVSLRTYLAALQVPSFYQGIVTGLVLLVALAIDGAADRLAALGRRVRRRAPARAGGHPPTDTDTDPDPDPVPAPEKRTA